VRIGIAAYGIPAAELVVLARAAEAQGFDALWLGEHLVIPRELASTHPAAEDHDAARAVLDPAVVLPDPLVTAGALAAATTRLVMGTAVYVLPLHHPVEVARAVATVHDLSGGRFVFGVGAGWAREEFDAVAVPFATRGARLEESVAVVRALWGGGFVRHAGACFELDDVQVSPRRVDVPVVLGGNSEPALRRAARCGDGWIVSSTATFDECLRLRDAVERSRHDQGTAGRPFRYVARVPAADAAVVDRYVREGFDDLLLWSHQLWPADGPDVDARLAAFAAAAERLDLAQWSTHRPAARAAVTPAVAG
jgi:probable F420-dependent oxidoreductase